MILVCEDEMDVEDMVELRLGCSGREMKSGIGAGEFEDAELEREAGRLPSLLLLADSEPTESTPGRLTGGSISVPCPIAVVNLRSRVVEIDWRSETEWRFCRRTLPLWWAIVS